MKTLYESILDVDDNMSNATDDAYKVTHPRSKKQLRGLIEQALKSDPNADLNWIDVSCSTLSVYILLYFHNFSNALFAFPKSNIVTFSQFLLTSLFHIQISTISFRFSNT
jgi:hypothetical protein